MLSTNVCICERELPPGSKERAAIERLRERSLSEDSSEDL